MPGKISLAACQFPVEADIRQNLSWVLMQMRISHARGAQIAHFPECSLSGYAGMDFDQVHDQNSFLLKESLLKISEAARNYGLWTVIGSHHFDGDTAMPYNSLYVINDKGDIQDRYDKRLLTAGEYGTDQQYYSPGSRPVLFEAEGIKTGLLICHEWRYPEVYREYKRLGAELILQSWYDGNMTYPEYQEAGKELGDLIVGTVKGNAANNHLWISASNTCKKESCFPAFVVRPDGVTLNRARRNEPGVVISEIDTSRKFPDPSAHLRDRLGDIIKH